MRSAALLAVFSSKQRLLGLAQQVLELDCLDQVGVPHGASVRDSDVSVLFADVSDLLAAALEQLLVAEHCCVSLHGLLHVQSHLRGAQASLRVAHFVETRNGFLADIRSKFLLRLARRVHFLCCVRSRAPENDQVKERIRAQSVCSVHTSASSLACSQKTLDNDVLSTVVCCESLGAPVGGNSSHVVVHSGQHRNRLLSTVDSCEDVCSLQNAGQSLV